MATPETANIKQPKAIRAHSGGKKLHDTEALDSSLGVSLRLRVYRASDVTDVTSP
jgi:hypothetical protein